MPTLHDIERAAAVLAAARLAPSPVLPFGGPTDGARVMLKVDALQPTGSFKIRGATYVLRTLPADRRTAGVVAYSTGNHAQAVARAAADAGVRATIVMSPDVPEAKLAATRALGAEVVLAEPTSAARRTLAEELAARTGAELVPPYDDERVMAGQGTIGLELLALPERPAEVYVPVGGGGLLAGVATAVKALDPTVRVVGVEPEWEDDGARSFRAGRLSAGSPSTSIADAIRVQELGRLTFPIIRALVDDMVTVTEHEIARATLDGFHHNRLRLEPAGAVAIAAARRGPARSDGRAVVALACGGNVTLDVLARLERDHPA